MSSDLGGSVFGDVKRQTIALRQTSGRLHFAGFMGGGAKVEIYNVPLDGKMLGNSNLSISSLWHGAVDFTGLRAAAKNR